MFPFANQLCHSPHRTESTPGPRLIEYHYNQPKQKRGQHQAVKAKAELCNPVRYKARRIGPAPRHAESPEKFDCFPQGRDARTDQPGLKQHIPEHGQEKGKEAISKPF